MSEMIPNGWLIMPLDEILISVKTGVPEFQGEKEYYSTGSVQGKKIIPEGTFSFKNKPSRANRIAIQDDVFQARMKETDKGFIASEKISDQLFSTGFLQLRPYGDTYSAKFLYYYVVSPCFINQKNELATGSTQEALTDNNAVSLYFPLPPLNEQMRIVAKLNQVIPRIDLVNERLDKIPAIIKRFRQSVLTAAVTGKLTEKWREKHPDVESAKELLERINNEGQGEKNYDKSIIFSTSKVNLPDSWIQISAEQINDHITKGTTPRNNDFVSFGIPYLKVYNIVNNKINFEYKSQFVTDELHNTYLSRSKVFPGDILMNIVGPPLGKIAIVPDTFNEWNINQALAIFRTRKMIVNQYLFFVLTEGECLAKLLIETRGVVGQSNLSLDQCRSLLVNLPPLEEQKEIVRQVDKLFALADKLESHYQRAKARVDKLSQSILAKAFRGELVITEAELAEKEGRDFESAEKLLERILNEKAKLVGTGKSRGKKKHVCDNG